ncbi:uncharacterized protein LOC117087422 [Trachypithecus francoisi]|uniref:uncharacterized protein LOC117087422 n=1 Tax=Trachypithecus francoisi TaxID=54180 RepID=UPI00141B2930|nr:uncharacterized protein LOC117087422 [Trachypithecus francoisi]
MPSEEGGARGSEIVKLCLGCARRRAVLALPWAHALGLRVSRERVSAAASRVLVCARVPGAARPSPAQLRCAQPPARSSARAARPLRLPGVLPTGSPTLPLMMTITKAARNSTSADLYQHQILSFCLLDLHALLYQQTRGRIFSIHFLD